MDQVTNENKRGTVISQNSFQLLRVLVEMIDVRGEKSFSDVHAICCAFNVPTLHLVNFLPQRHSEAFLSQKSRRFVFSASHQRTTLRLLKGFELMQNSMEKHGCFRYLHEVFCLVRKMTADFKYAITQRCSTTTVAGAMTHVKTRIERLLGEVFGEQYEKLLGDGIVMAVLNAYLILNGYQDWCVPFQYDQKIRTCVNQQERRTVQHFPRQIHEKIDWFMTGRHRPLGDATAPVRLKPPALDHKCVMLDYPDAEAMMHVNIQVAHLRVFSKTRMRYGICGKSLVFTVAKKKTIACSSYKTVVPDNVVMTHNSLNFNIHGYDTTMMTALLMLDKTTDICGFDDTDPYTTSHNRTSSHSFQNGVMDINNYRQKVMENYPKICSKVPYFPAVKMTDLGLLHRETVLFNTKGDIEKAVNQIYRIVRSSAEIDLDLAHTLYRLESEVREMVDNHILGMVKVANLFGMKRLVDGMTKLVKFDRLLVALNPKTTKSEFADKSKFDSESKGKASKKIKIPDETKDRRGFIIDMNETFPDVSIDHANANSRGKWSFLDRINHSPDWTFYSPMTRLILHKLKDAYGKDRGFVSFNDMVDTILRHLKQ